MGIHGYRASDPVTDCDRAGRNPAYSMGTVGGLSGTLDFSACDGARRALKKNRLRVVQAFIKFPGRLNLALTVADESSEEDWIYI